MIEKERFVTNLLKESTSVQNSELAEYFFGLGDKKANLFSNFYDTLYSKKISEIHQLALAGIFDVFLTSHDDIVNNWIIEQVAAEDSKTPLFLSKLQDLRSSTYSLEFDGLPAPTIAVIQTCNTTLLDLLTTKEGEEELAKRQILSLVKKNLTTKYFSFVEPILSTMSVVNYDIKNNKITVSVSNKIDRFILWSIRNQIVPFQIIITTDPLKDTLIKKIDQDIDRFSANNKLAVSHSLEVVDIDLGAQEILIKAKGGSQEDILLGLQSFLQDHLTVQNIPDDESVVVEDDLSQMVQKSLLLADQEFFAEISKILPEGVSLGKFHVKLFNTSSSLVFMQNYFAKFLFESQIDTSGLIYQLSDFSFKPFLNEKQNRKLGKILISIPDAATYNSLESMLDKSPLAKPKFDAFFGGLEMDYRIDTSLAPAQTKSVEKKVIELPKAKNATFSTSPLAVKVDVNKTFENFHALSPDKVQRVLYTIQSRKNIAICGDSGTGKTHFTQALVNHFSKDSVVGYTTGEVFMRHYIKSVADYQQATDKTNPSFKKSASYKDFMDLFQGLDYLIIEDIESIEGTKVGTQTVLKTIVNQNPNMGLIVTGKKNLSDMFWQKKISSFDGAVGEATANIATELKLTPVLLEKIGDDNLKTIIVQQRTAFCDKRNFSKKLPVGVVSFLADRVNASHYDQIFESIYLNADDDFSCDRIFGVIQNFVSEGLKPTPDQIIHIVIESFLKHSDAWKPYLNFENMGIDIDVFLDKYNETTLRNKLGTSLKADSLEGIILRLCVFYVKDAYPKKKFTEIGSYLDNRKDCSKLCDEATSWLISSKATKGHQSLDQFMKGEIRKFLLDTYGIKEQQLSLF